MNSELERQWYVAITVDMRVRTNPRIPVTYWLVTYRAPGDAIETRFVYEQVGGADPTAADWQRIVREHKTSLTL